jgi:hypothetical protein
MGKINSNCGYCFSAFGKSSVTSGIYKNFTACGLSKLMGLICTNLFTSSGYTKIKTSQLNKMRVSGTTKLRQSTAGEIHSSGHLEASHCPKLGKIQASGHASLNHCQDIKEIVASGAFSLDCSKVQGNVTLTGNEATITGSTIVGKLQCAEKIVKISNSSIGRIIVRPVNNNWRFEILPFWSYLRKSSPQEQVIELSGKNCQTPSISFEDGAFGKVYLQNGATRPTVTGAAVII